VYGANVPILIDHLFALVLAVLFPIRAALFGYRRLTLADEGDVPRVRMWLYRQGIAIQWLLTLVALALWVWQRRPWVTLGVVPVPTWGLVGVAAGFTVMAVYILSQRRKAMDDDDAMQRLRRQMRNIERMMPRSREELRWFGRLAVTAGICEELLYRGYLIWYLSSWMAIVPAALVASVVFGLGHAYQGPRGIALTSLVGVFMSAIYLLTGSLLACMVIHALMDLHAGTMAHAAFAREGTATSAVPSEPDGQGPALPA
jgi:membrane protease YdiL (CAAX protease family)